MSTFPFEAVRDLLGILRLLEADERSRSLPLDARLEALRDLQSELRWALDSADRGQEEQAWDRAERAVARLGAVVRVAHTLEPVLLTAGRLIRGQAAPRDDRTLRKLGRR